MRIEADEPLGRIRGFAELNRVHCFTVAPYFRPILAILGTEMTMVQVHRRQLRNQQSASTGAKSSLRSSIPKKAKEKGTLVGVEKVLFRVKRYQNLGIENVQKTKIVVCRAS